MSPFKRPRITIFVAPDQVYCRDVTRGLESAEPFRALINSHADLEAALRDYLAVPSRRAARLQVLLSSKLTHFLAVPWSDALLDPREANAYLHAAFGSVLGENANHLRVTTEDCGLREPRLACGIETACVESLERAAQSAGARIDWMGPWLTLAWRRHCREVDQRDVWWVAHEPSMIAVAAVRGGEIAEVSTHHTEVFRADLERQIKRQTLREGIEKELPIWIADAVDDRDGWPTAWRGHRWLSRQGLSWQDRILGLAA